MRHAVRPLTPSVAQADVQPCVVHLSRPARKKVHSPCRKLNFQKGALWWPAFLVHWVFAISYVCVRIYTYIYIYIYSFYSLFVHFFPKKCKFTMRPTALHA